MSFSGDIPAVADNAICTAPHVRGSGTRLLSPAMQEYIRHVAQQPGGVPNHVEKTSSAELPRIVSAHVRDLHASHCGEVTRGDDSVRNPAGCLLTVCNTDRGPNRELAHSRLLVDFRAAGAVFIAL